MNLAFYIYSFLKDRGGNIEIPNFGVFSMHKLPAIVDEEASKILPPREIISFEKIEEAEDEELLRYISDKTRTEQQTIQSFIQTEVDKWNRELAENRKLDLENLGMIEMLESGEIVFVQKSVADSMEYFGLEEIPLKEIELPNKDYTFRRAVFWIFLALVSILIFLGLQYRDLLFDNPFDNIHKDESVIKDSVARDTLRLKKDVIETTDSLSNKNNYEDTASR